MVAILVRTSALLDRLCRWGGALGLVLMVLMIGLQVVARYILADPPAWTEEAARYAMVWSGLLGATVAFRGGLDPVLLRLAAFDTGGLRRVGAGLRGLATLLFLGPIWYFCLFGPNYDITRGYIGRSMLRTTEALGVSMAWFTSALPLAITVILIHMAAGLAGGERSDARS